MVGEVTRVAGVVIAEKGSASGSIGFLNANSVLQNLGISDLTTGKAINNSARRLADARDNNPTSLTAGISNSVLATAQSIGKFINPTSLPGFTEKMVDHAWGKSGALLS